MTDGSTNSAFEQLRQAQTPSSRAFWVAGPDGQAKEATTEELQQMLVSGYDGPVLAKDDTDQTWKTAAHYGVTPPAPEAPPAPPAGVPGAPPPPPEGGPPAAPAGEASAPAGVPANVPATRSTAALPATLEVDEEAALQLFDQLNLPSEGTSLASIAEEVDAAGVMSHSLPFAALRRGQWEVSKSAVPDDIYEFMPVGQRDFHCVYIAHRVGLTAWQGAGSASKGGSPPLWSAVIPHPRADGDAPDLIRRVLAAGRKVQYTKKDDRGKFDGVGRISPEIQILGWRPDTGFIILLVAGFSPTADSLSALKAVEGQPNRPVRVLVHEETVVNKKVHKEDPTADNASWLEHHLKAEVDTSDRSAQILRGYQEHLQRDKATIAKGIMSFLTGQDYTGLSKEALKEKLDAYDAID